MKIDIILTAFLTIVLACVLAWTLFFSWTETYQREPIKETQKINYEVIEAKVGDEVVLKIFNEDSYDHGFALEVFGINKRLFPRSETEIRFIASKVGGFTFYCSVPCGEGHYQQTGKFIITE